MLKHVYYNLCKELDGLLAFCSADTKLFYEWYEYIEYIEKHFYYKTEKETC